MVHAALIAHLSKPLDRLINGHMSEAREQCALLEDMDEHIFVRFSEFAYTGNYVDAEPDIILDSSLIEAPDAVEVDGHEDAQMEEDGSLSAATMDQIAEAMNFAAEAPTEEAATEEAPPAEPAPADDSDSFHTSRRKGKKKKKFVGWGDGPPAEAFLMRSKKERMWSGFEDRVYALSDQRTSTHHFSARPNREACEDYKPVLLCHAQLYVFA